MNCGWCMNQAFSNSGNLRFLLHRPRWLDTLSHNSDRVHRPTGRGAAAAWVVGGGQAVALPCGSEHIARWPPRSPPCARRRQGDDSLRIRRRLFHIHYTVTRIGLTAPIGRIVRHCEGRARPVNQTLAPRVRVRCAVHLVAF